MLLYPKDRKHRADHGVSHCVYIVYHVEFGKPSKIGHSSRPISNLAALQVGNPHELAIFHRFYMANAKRAYSTEQSIHRAMEKAGINRMMGEWFDILAEDAKQFIINYLQRREMIKNASRGWTKDIEAVLWGV